MKHVVELAKRYLAPGHTLAYDANAGKVVIKRTLKNRPFRSGAYLTPIFLDSELFAENKMQYWNIIERLDIEIFMDDEPEPVLEYRKTFESIIDAIPKKDLTKETQYFFNVIQNFRTAIGFLRILFTRI